MKIFKTNKTNLKKLIARGIIIALLLSETLLFTSCNGGERAIVDRDILFTSNDEFINFINKYNSQNDGFVYTFVDFDFSEHCIRDAEKMRWNTWILHGKTVMISLKCMIIIIPTDSVAK